MPNAPWTRSSVAPPIRGSFRCCCWSQARSPLGRRQNWPIFAAAERHGLPVGIHAGSTYRHPVTPVGWPARSFVEDYVNQAAAFASQLTSLVAEGVFAKFPDLTVVLLESGVSWLPAHLWRLTKFWKGLGARFPGSAIRPTDDRARAGAADIAATGCAPRTPAPSASG